jgi:hypothetical protein
MTSILRLCAFSAWLFLCGVPSAFAQGDDAAFEAARATYLAGQHAAALEILDPMARAGHPGARNILADAYDAGNGVDRDPQRALDLYRAAAAQGLARASYNLGVLLTEGRPGIPADVAQAIVHYEDAMAQDYAAAFNNRGVLYTKGQGGAADPVKAVEMFRRAHELGDLNGTDNLADMLRRGEGVAADVPRALELWRGAAARGHGPSINNLGAMYANGIGVATDTQAAFALYLLAARKGALQAGLNLAAAFADDVAPRHDDLRALAWCLWSQDRAPAHQTAEIAATCAVYSEILSAEDTAAARALADTLNQ